MLKPLSMVCMAKPSSEQTCNYTFLAIFGYALKYLPTTHNSEPDIHEQAIGLQMATALQLFPYIQQSLSALMATDSTNQVYTCKPEKITCIINIIMLLLTVNSVTNCEINVQNFGELVLPESIAAVFVQLTSKHPNKLLGHALLLL